jgi:hypothetical protein
MHIKPTISVGLWFCFLLIILAALSRLVPHPPNFTPIGALGLFAGAYIAMRRYWLVPLAALLISDILIGFYHPATMLSVYLAFIICTVLGRVVLLEKRSVFRVGATTLSASVIFFIISNLGDWLSGVNYPLTWEGLVTCYVMAIPFFSNTVLGDLFYVVLLFGTYEAARSWIEHSQGIRSA